MNIKNWFWSCYFSKKEQLILWGIVLIGLTARIYISYTNALWRDEVSLFYTAYEKSFFDLIFQNYWDTVHPSLYFIIIHFWQKISIQPDFLRSLSMVLSFLTLYLLPILAIKIFPKYKLLPFIFLFLYALSSSQISLNIVVRPYALVMLLITISLIVFIHLLRCKKISTGTITLFVVVNTFIGWTDYSGVWLILTYFAYTIPLYLFTKNTIHNTKNVIWGFGLTVLFSIPGIILFVQNIHSSLGITARTLSKFFNSQNLLQSNLSQLNFFNNTLQTDFLVQQRLIPAEYLSFILTIISFTGILIVNKEYFKEKFFLISLILVPLISSFLFSLIISPIFLGRNLHIVNFTMLLGIALFTTILFNKFKIVSLVLISLYALNFYLSDKSIQYVDPPYDWRSVANIIARDTSPTFITNEPVYIFDPIKYYSMVQNGPSVRISAPLMLTSMTPRNFYFINTIRSPYKRKLDDIAQDYSTQMGCKLIKIPVNYLEITKCTW